MTPAKLYAAGIVAAVVLFLGLAGVAALHARDEANRKRGAQMQQAEDVMTADRMKDSLATVMQARLDSVQRVKDSIESQADGTFVAVQTKYRDRIVHDTVVAAIVTAAKADVLACKDGRAACEVRAANAEQETARLRFTVQERDSTILERAKAVAIPRSCAAPNIAYGVGGLLVGAIVARAAH